ncbi:MAG: biopolymer transporter ExbD [Sphingomonas sp.]|nr:MAG: biopolymer transporter ExbD [Sphingomonas sp.]
MAMSTGGGGEDAPLSDINTTPLVDVMLGGQCAVFWNQSRVRSQELLQLAVDKLKTEIDRQGGPNAAGLTLPEAHIRGDVNSPYRCIGGTIFTMQQAGFARVGFISEPAPAGG